MIDNNGLKNNDIPVIGKPMVYHLKMIGASYMIIVPTNTIYHNIPI